MTFKTSLALRSHLQLKVARNHRSTQFQTDRSVLFDGSCMLYYPSTFRVQWCALDRDTNIRHLPRHSPFWMYWKPTVSSEFRQTCSCPRRERNTTDIGDPHHCTRAPQPGFQNLSLLSDLSIQLNLTFFYFTFVTKNQLQLHSHFEPMMTGLIKTSRGQILNH